MNVNKTIVGLFGPNAAGSIVLPILGAGYSVHTVSKNSISPKSFCRYFCSGLNGAFASKCLADWVPIIAQYTKPMIDYIVSSASVELLMGKLMLSGTLLNEFIIQPSSFIWSVLSISIVFAVVVAAAIYRANLKMSLSIIISAVTAQVIVNFSII